MTNTETLTGTLRETIPCIYGNALDNMRGRILAGTEVRITEATRSTYFVEEYGMGRWAELSTADMLAVVEPI